MNYPNAIAMATYGEATITVSEFNDSYFILSEDAEERLRNGETLVLEGVPFKDAYPVGNPSIKDSLMFNVAAMSNINALDEMAFMEDGEPAVLVDDMVDQDLIGPTYTNWSDNRQLDQEDYPLQGQKCDVSIEMVELEDGREILDVVDFRPQSISSGVQDQDISTSSAIDSESQEQEETPEGEPVESPK